MTRIHASSTAPRPASRFAGRNLADLFGVDGLIGVYEEDVWDFDGHPDTADGGGKRRHYFDDAPPGLRDPLKEFFLLAVRPQVHTDSISPDLMGVAPKDVKTVQRMYPGLVADLSWLTARTTSGLLREVTQEHLDALQAERTIDHRRVAALQSFGRYASGMSPALDTLTVQPWQGRSALSVAGGLPDNDGRNTTPLFAVEAMWPWLETAMLLVTHGVSIVDVANRELVTDLNEFRPGTGRLRNAKTRSRPARRTMTFDLPDGDPVRWFSSDCTRQQAQKMVGYVAAACAFLTVAFTGMRASEMEAIPRTGNLDDIELGGARRPLLTSYLVKRRETPKPEQWLIPPIVADAVRVMQYLLDSSHIAADQTFPPTGLPPLFDRRALASMRRSSGPTVMRLERVIDRLQEANESLSGLGLVPRHLGVAPTGRQLRRNLSIVVSSRQGGPQAAMEQFKWQSPETASGYFRVAPDAIATGQRQVFQEVAELHADLVVDALRDEFTVWEKHVHADESTDFPLGQDGRRKRDMFAAVRNEMGHEPRVEEDDRRLRSLLRTHAENMHLTEFGWCDFDEAFARCGGIGGPNPAKCDPYACLNHSTPSTSVGAHVVKHDRLLQITTNRQFPTLAREKARADAETIADHLGPHLLDKP
ncbi:MULTISPECIES: hypothetical protein [unclassified Nocardioides]|uniref:hypothetical protein n=1 Tax=unclassified Nocardioides TaxID=2615069 RepID=UPI0030155B82